MKIVSLSFYDIELFAHELYIVNKANPYQQSNANKYTDSEQIVK